MTHLSILCSALGAALHNLQPQQQSPEQFYLSLQKTLSELTLLEGLEERLTVVLQHLHQALMPTQTSLYCVAVAVMWNKNSYHNKTEVRLIDNIP